MITFEHYNFCKIFIKNKLNLNYVYYCYFISKTYYIVNNVYR